MSALPPKADMCGAPAHVRFVPIANIQPSFDHLVTEREQRRGHARDARPHSKFLYNRGMNENLFTELSAWMTHAGLAGTPETDIVSVFCDRCVAAGIPLDRAHVFIDTLHPVYEGRMFRWGYSPNESPVHEYGRTSSEGPAVSGPVSLDEQATDMWRRGPFYNMLQTGASLLRRRLKTDTVDEFSLLPEWLAAGMTDYVAIITRFAPEGVLVRWMPCTHHGGQGRPRDSTMAKSPRLSISCRPSRLPSNQCHSRA